MLVDVWLLRERTEWEARALFAGLPHQIDLGPAELTRFDNGTFVARYRLKQH